jgi:outer membrane protein assembly factor BamB
MRSTAPFNTKMRLPRIATALALCLAAFSPGALAGDWPQLLGPDRDGTAAADETLPEEWPNADGPPVLWEREVGQGLAGPAVKDDRVVFIHRRNRSVHVDCLDAATGERRWRFTYPTDYVDNFGFDEGPRAVPTLDAGRVYTYGAEGMLHCLDLETGEKRWAVDAVDRYASDKGFFGRACSPLVLEDQLLIQVGGRRGGPGIVALDKRTGETLWKATEHAAGYASPVAATIHGRRYALCLTRQGLVGLDPESGRVSFEREFRSSFNASVNAASPVTIGDRIFLSACYGTGAALLRVTEDHTLRELWTADDALNNHYATSVHHEGHLYGFHGRQDAPPIRLRCVRLNDAEVQWTAPKTGAGTVLIADGRLLVLTERGELILAPATPEGFDPTARAEVFDTEVRAYPALADGRLYARDENVLRCFDLNPER